MSPIETSRRYEAPRAEVFALFADLAGAADHVSGIERVELLTDGPVGVGTRWRETRVMCGKEATEEMEITEFEPGVRYLVEAASCGSRYRTELTFADAGDAATLVTMTFESRPASVLAYVFLPLAWLMAGTLRRCLERDLADLDLVLVARR